MSPRLRNISPSKGIPAPDYTHCIAKSDQFGKPGITVLEHSRNVAEVARHLVESLPEQVRNKLGAGAISAAALHDVGKVSPGFQLKYFRGQLAKREPVLAERSSSSFETDHCRTGASAVWRHIGSPFACPSLAEVVAIHHGSIRKAPLPKDDGEVFGGPCWAVQRLRLIHELEKWYGAADAQSLLPPVRNCLAGLVTVADWIGSDEMFFPPSGLPFGVTPAEVAARAVDACGFRKPAIRTGLSFETAFGYTPYPLQARFGEVVSGPGLYILEAPMGMGKTEAALFAAYRLMVKGHNNGFFFGLPTRLTSDRIHERVTTFLKRICPEDPHAKLAHGTAWLSVFRAGGEEFRAGKSWFNPRKRALLSPFVVGTIDQALLSVLRVKHYFVRTFALAGKVVILDEVHSYDGYTGTLMDGMVRDLLHLGCTVIILTATLTAERRKAFFADPAHGPDSIDYPLISTEVGENAQCVAAPSPQARTYRLRLSDWDDTEVAGAAIDRARSGNCVLVIANTVGKAQAWFTSISATMNQEEFPIGLLHSKFPDFRRAEIENNWMECLGKPGSERERPKGCILVATQVVEQSVDIDADYLITELAPTDMLLQRMGRQWRHDRQTRPSPQPEAVVVCRDLGGAETAEEFIERLGRVNSLVYSPYVLWKTWQVWQSRPNVTLPPDIRGLLEETYREGIEMPPGVAELRRIFREQRDKLESLAKANRATVASMPTGEDREGVATRYSDLPTTQALLVKRIDSTGKQAVLDLLDGSTVKLDAWTPDIRTTAALHGNLVTIATYLLEKTGEVATPAYLEKHFFEPTPVLAWDELSGELTLDGKATGLTYSLELGVARTERKPVRESDMTYGSEYDDVDVFDKTRFDW